jgi:hypothetical protein
MLRRALRWPAVFIAVVVSVSALEVSTARADTAHSIAHYIMGVFYEFQEDLPAALREYQQSEGLNCQRLPRQDSASTL